MCKCKDIELGSQKYMDRKITVAIPEHMRGYKYRRIIRGAKPFVCIDPCAVDEIKHLWSLGIETIECCCGHNINESYVSVEHKSILKMIELGYKFNHPDKRRLETFKLKSC